MRPDLPPAPLRQLTTAFLHPGPVLRAVVPVALGLLLGIYLTVLYPWMLGWGATTAERLRGLPGDELVPVATDQSTRAVTVRAPADETWRWLVQLGEDRAGFYSHSWLENLFVADIHNGDRVRPEWQTLREGDLVRAVPDDYLGGILPEPGWRVAAAEPGRWFVLRNWGVFLVEPVDAATSRLIVRTRFHDETWWGPIVTALAFEPVHFVMERQMLLGIKARAEGRLPSPALDALVAIGFAVGVVGVALLFGHRPRATPWLVLPTLLLAGVVARTGDWVAGAAGFVALGLVILALPQLRRRWPALLPVPAVVLLVLLLVPRSDVAFALIFLVGGATASLTMAARGAGQPASRGGSSTRRFTPASTLAEWRSASSSSASSVNRSTAATPVRSTTHGTLR